QRDARGLALFLVKEPDEDGHEQNAAADAEHAADGPDSQAEQDKKRNGHDFASHSLANLRRARNVSDRRTERVRTNLRSLTLPARQVILGAASELPLFGLAQRAAAVGGGLGVDVPEQRLVSVAQSRAAALHHGVRRFQQPAPFKILAQAALPPGCEARYVL